MTVDLPEACRPEVEATVYFIVAETLADAARHSGATHATVLVRRSRAGVSVRAADGGTGGATLGGSLRGLHDRVLALGGEMTLVSPPGRGTEVAAVLPGT